MPYISIYILDFIYFIIFHHISSSFIIFHPLSNMFRWFPPEKPPFSPAAPGHCHVRRHRRQQAPCHGATCGAIGGAVTFLHSVDPVDPGGVSKDESTARRSTARTCDFEPYIWLIYIYIWLLYMVVIYGLYMAIFLIGFDCYICFPFVSRSFPVAFCML